MFSTRGWILGGLMLLGASATPAGADEGYVLVLKDGSFVQAAEKPTVEAGLAQVRLPSGLLAQIRETGSTGSAATSRAGPSRCSGGRRRRASTCRRRAGRSRGRSR